jgi:hypothetical protein
LLLVVIASVCWGAEEIELLSTLTVAGDAIDASGATGEFENGIPKNQFGGFSAIAYSGSGDRYIVLADRGPDDGAVPYGCRFHEVDLSLSDSGSLPTMKILATHFLRRGDDLGDGLFSGSAADSGMVNGIANRLDPEGVRLADNGDLIVSEEYGPSIYRFDATGVLLGRLPVPTSFQIKTPGLTKHEENASNIRGRQGNGGLEGLAVSADGKTLTAILQGPLLQDHAFDDAGEDFGRMVRILQLDLEAGTQKQFVYPLEKAGFGVSEIIDYGSEHFLVLERDSKPGQKSKSKSLHKISCAAATDVSAVDSLAADRLPVGVVPVTKEVFLDLREDRFGLADRLPKKIEGLAWGPNLKDGRKLLVVCSDNDFETDQDSQFYFFAVGP